MDGTQRVIGRGRTRILLSVLAALTVVVITATTVVALSSSNSVQPAAAVTVKVLVSKTANQTATGAGATAALTTNGGVSTRAVCTDMGGGTFKVEFQMKSSAAGSVLLSSLGSVAITGSFATMYNVSNGTGYGYHEDFDVMANGGTFQHYDVDFNIHQLGHDCVTRVAVLND